MLPLSFKQFKFHISLFNSVPSPQFWTDTAQKFNIKVCLLNRDASSRSYEKSAYFGMKRDECILQIHCSFLKYLSLFPWRQRALQRIKWGNICRSHMLEFEQQITALTTDQTFLKCQQLPLYRNPQLSEGQLMDKAFSSEFQPTENLSHWLLWPIN